MPLALVIVRYFAYVVAGLGAVWLATFLIFSATMNMGLVWSANYGPSHVDETAALVRAGSFTAERIPTAYRYARLASDGSVIATDLDEKHLERALIVVDERFGGVSGLGGADDPAQITGQDGTTYAAFALADGTACILTCTYMPQFADRALAGALPNPQDLMLAGGVAGSIAAVALIARRASRVLARKMAPLAEAARRIGAQDLDHALVPDGAAAGGVREVNEVLAAMDAMRASLKDALEARWAAEQREREQVAALAHDLKTPLTVVRANAEFVSEEAGELAARVDDAAERLAEVAAAAHDAAAGAKRLDGYVHLLIEASRGAATVNATKDVAVTALFDAIEDQGRSLARTAGLAFDAELAPDADGARLVADRDALERAVMNVVSNACDHARTEVRVRFVLDREGAEAGPTGSERASEGPEPASRYAASAEPRPTLVITVEDDGAGFSPAALVHGCERFFRDDAARSSGGARESAGAHYGLGLATAVDIVRAHGGTIVLSNHIDAAGHPTGAHVTLTLPLRQQRGA